MLPGITEKPKSWRQFETWRTKKAQRWSEEAGLSCLSLTVQHTSLSGYNQLFIMT